MLTDQTSFIDCTSKLDNKLAIRPPETNRRTMYKRSVSSKRSSPSQSTNNEIAVSKSPLNRHLLNIVIWMIILLSQSTKANSVFLESCSSSNINQVFCHNDQLYVIQDSVLYYGNSCGQMMTNETIRITKKFRTAVQMKTSFIDDKNSIYLFSVSSIHSTTLCILRWEFFNFISTFQLTLATTLLTSTLPIYTMNSIHVCIGLCVHKVSSLYYIVRKVDDHGHPQLWDERIQKFYD